MGAVVILVALLLTASMAGQNPCVQLTPVNVLDQNGVQVTGLTTSSFDAHVRNRPIHLLSAAAETRARRVLILLDISGSMSEPLAKWDTALLMTKDAANRLPSEDVTGFATFADRLDLRTSFHKDKGPLLEAVRKVSEPPTLRPHGHTALFDAIADAASAFGVPMTGDVIYVITDGGDNQSRRVRKEVEEILQRRGIRLFLLIIDFEPFGHKSWRNPKEEAAIQEAEQLAEDTGGVSGWYDSPMLEAVPENVKQQILGGATKMYRLIHSGYVLKVDLPESLDRPEKWKLTVPRKKVKVLYPHQLFPCASTPSPAALLSPQ